MEGNTKKDDEATSKKDTKEKEKRAVAELVKKLVGDRSLRKAGEDSGVAPSYINGILKANYLPSARILRQLTLPEAKPQNGISMEDLMVAAGYQASYFDVMYVYPNAEEDKGIDGSENNDRLYIETKQHESPNQAMKRFSAISDVYTKYLRFENLAKGIICKTLLEKGVSFRKNEVVNGIRSYKPDMAINISDMLVKEWWFEFKYFEDNKFRGGYSNLKFRTCIDEFVFTESKEDRKISIVTSSTYMFDYLKAYKDKMSYRGDLSVILINEEDYSISSEVYISHYNMNDDSSEFYII